MRDSCHLSPQGSWAAIRQLKALRNILEAKRKLHRLQRTDLRNHSTRLRRWSSHNSSTLKEMPLLWEEHQSLKPHSPIGRVALVWSSLQSTVCCKGVPRGVNRLVHRKHSDCANPEKTRGLQRGAARSPKLASLKKPDEEPASCIWGEALRSIGSKSALQRMCPFRNPCAQAWDTSPGVRSRKDKGTC